jgi:hypothetical protein
MKVGDGKDAPLLKDVLGDMDNRELAGFARSTIGERMTPDEKAAANVLERARSSARPRRSCPARRRRRRASHKSDYRRRRASRAAAGFLPRARSRRRSSTAAARADAYIRKFMRPAAGAETIGDLERGMAALGRKGELPEHERRPLHPRAARPGQADAGPGRSRARAVRRPRGRARRSMSPAAAEAAATKRTLDALDFEALEKRRRSLLQVKAQDFAEDWLTRGGEHWGGGDRGGGGRRGHSRAKGRSGRSIPRRRRRLIGLVEARRKAIEGEAFGHIAEILRNHRAIVPGVLRHAPSWTSSAWRRSARTAAASRRRKRSARSRHAGMAAAARQRRRRQHRQAREPRLRDAPRQPQGRRGRVRRLVGGRAAALGPRAHGRRGHRPAVHRAELLEAARAVHATIASDGALDRAPGAAGR